MHSCTATAGTVTYTTANEVYTDTTCTLIGTQLNLVLATTNNVCDIEEEVPAPEPTSNVIGIAVGVSVGGVVLIAIIVVVVIVI